MSLLRTEVVPDAPNVLIISTEEEIANKIQHEYILKKFNAMVVSLDQFVENRESFLAQEYYKIFLITGFDSSKFQKYSIVINALKKKASFLVVIGRLMSDFKQESLKFVSWRKQTQYLQELFLRLKKALSQAQFVFALNIIDEKNLRYPIKAMFESQQQYCFLDFKSDIRLLDVQGFINIIKPYLFKPGGSKKIIVRGQNIANSQIVYYFFYLIYKTISQKIKIEKNPVTLNDPELSFWKIVDYHIDLNKINPKKMVFLIKKEWSKSAVLNKTPSKIEIDNRAVSSQLKSKVVQDNDQKKEISKPSITSTPAKTLVDKPATIKASADEIIEKKQATPDNQKLSAEKMRDLEGKIDSQIKNIFRLEAEAHIKSRRKKRKLKENKIDKKKTIRFLLSFIGFLAMVVSIVVVIFFIALKVNEHVLNKSLSSFFQKKINSEEITHSPTIEKIANFYNKQLSLVDGVSFINVRDKLSLARMSKKMVSYSQSITTLDKTYKELFLVVLNKGKGNLTLISDSVKQHSSSVYENLSLIVSELETNSELKNKYFSEEDWEVFKEKVLSDRKSVAKLNVILPQLISWIDETPDLQLAILWQDNYISRPTGGLIQSVALLSFEKGQLKSSKVYTAEEIDQLLVGRVEAPADLKTQLQVNHLQFKNVNWDPNVPETNKRISWFLKEALGQNIDGVVMIDNYFSANLIEKMGQLNISQEGENYNLDSSQSVLKLLSKNDIKRDVLSLKLFEGILEKINSDGENLYPTLPSLFFEGLESNQVFITTKDSELEKILESINWAGNIVSPVCPVQFDQNDCVIDYFFSVEVDIDSSKLIEMNKSIQHEIDLTSDKVFHSRRITYEPIVKGNNEVAVVKKYIRYYLPLNSNLLALKVNDKEMGSAMTIDGDLEKQVVSAAIEFSNDKKTEVSIQYQTYKTNTSPLSYLFFVQKQQGQNVYSQDVTVKYLEKWSPKKIAPFGDLKNNQLLFHDESLEHYFIGVDFD